MMGRRIDAETHAAIVQKYLSDENATYKDIAEHFGINQNTISKIIKKELQAGNGIKPDRRAKKPENPWMEYITPLHQHKMELEQKVEHKQAELDAAKQELRDFTATLKQLMEDTA
jgi:transposase-like protein